MPPWESAAPGARTKVAMRTSHVVEVRPEPPPPPRLRHEERSLNSVPSLELGELMHKTMLVEIQRCFDEQRQEEAYQKQGRTNNTTNFASPTNTATNSIVVSSCASPSKQSRDL